MKLDKYKDYLVGFVLIVVGIYLMVGKNVVTGVVISETDVELAKADTYLRFLGLLLTIASAAMVLSSVIKGFRAKKEAEPAGEEGPDSVSKWFVVGFFVGAIVFALLIKVIGFFFDTLWFAFALSLYLQIREQGIDLHDKKALGTAALKSLIYALILDVALYLAFTKILKVKLP